MTFLYKKSSNLAGGKKFNLPFKIFEEHFSELSAVVQAKYLKICNTF